MQYGVIRPQWANNLRSGKYYTPYISSILWKTNYRMPTLWIYTPPQSPIRHTVMRWNEITWIMGMIICAKYETHEAFWNTWLTPFGHWSKIFTHDSITHENHCLHLSQWWPNKSSSWQAIYNSIYTGPYTPERSGLRQLVGTSDRFPLNELD